MDPIETLEHAGAADGSPCIVAVDGETVVGFAIWSLDTVSENGEGRARLETLHLRADLRGSGIGRRLFDRAAADAAEAGAAEIRWGTPGQPSGRVLSVRLERTGSD
ncbi:GNAT family N-acetyltransferase [Leucobacter weissii]|uniref:GNAT family N-acetyltransferase n=1 Tax=Leucobacter weissii TaxID=1983706 RepID=A0A939SAE5_9MICO|nr:GNAT family N-acetyltransferase [Leucobacter weissii]